MDVVKTVMFKENQFVIFVQKHNSILDMKAAQGGANIFTGVE